MTKGPKNQRPPVTSKHTDKSVRIYFGGHLHLYFRRARVCGIQAWREKGDSFPYKIEVTATDGHRITVEYDRDWKWKKVLERLNESFEAWK